MARKIVIIGPESTGKSTLCKQLASHYSTQWCPEFAREYLTKNGTSYNYNDLLTIARGQIALETTFEAMLEPNDLLFLDTNLYVMNVWCEFVFNKCHDWILKEIASRTYELYLLCNIDLPWTKDELREYPDLATRKILFNIYEDLLINQPTPWVIISGAEDKRKEAAIKAVDAFIK